MEKTIYIQNNITDPAYNLALEQYVFDELPQDREYFWLWQNDRAIVVGKHQNTIQEINAGFVRENDIRVVRRLSGGGAVYHDLGNVNFTFVANAGDIAQLDLQKFCKPVIRTLEKIGISATLSGRNDISINGKKFSGNSQYVKNGRILHHGTLMFDSDLDMVQNALKVSEDKYQSKGFKSVRSRVTNIRPYARPGLTLEDFCRILKTNIIQRDVQVYQPGMGDIVRIMEIKKNRYDTWEWNYGASPACSVKRTRRFEGVGQIELQLNVENGCIAKIYAYGDFFGEGCTKELEDLLEGCPLRAGVLHDRLSGFDLNRSFRGLSQKKFVELLLG